MGSAGRSRFPSRNSCCGPPPRVVRAWRTAAMAGRWRGDQLSGSRPQALGVVSGSGWRRRGRHNWHKPPGFPPEAGRRSLAIRPGYRYSTTIPVSPSPTRISDATDLLAHLVVTFGLDGTVLDVVFRNEQVFQFDAQGTH